MRHKNQLSKHHDAEKVKVTSGSRLRGGQGEEVVAETRTSRARTPQPGPRSLGSGVKVASAGIIGTLSPPGGHWLQVLLLLSRVWKWESTSSFPFPLHQVERVRGEGGPDLCLKPHGRKFGRTF